MRSICERYGGTLETRVDNDGFHLLVCLSPAENGAHKKMPVKADDHVIVLAARTKKWYDKYRKKSATGRR